MSAQYDNLVGQTLGQFLLLEPLGRGGMGVVYKAREQGAIQRDVALKVISPVISADKDAKTRFLREIQTVADLEHPHIVPVFASGTIGNLLFVAMRLLAGGSLADRMAHFNAQGRLPSLAECSTLLIQVADALDYAHGKGVIHRDLKPANIMFDGAGRAYLVDFGIAKSIDATQLTRTHLAVGTPAYLSPEQCQGQAATAASDQYSIGIVMYYMLSGRLPFESETPYGLIHLHVHAPPPAIRTYRPDVPEQLQSILERTLAKAPSDRFPSVGAFAQAFRSTVERSIDSGNTNFFTQPLPRNFDQQINYPGARATTVIPPWYKQTATFIFGPIVLLLGVIVLLLVISQERRDQIDPTEVAQQNQRGSVSPIATQGNIEGSTTSVAIIILTAEDTPNALSATISATPTQLLQTSPTPDTAQPTGNLPATDNSGLPALLDMNGQTAPADSEFGPESAVALTAFIMDTPSATFSLTPTATVTRRPTRTATATASNTPTVTLTMTSSATATPSQTPTHTFTSTNTPSPSMTSSLTATITPSLTWTPTNSATPSLTPTWTVVPSNTASVTHSPSPSHTMTATLSNTPTASLTPTASMTPTQTPSATVTLTASVTPSPTRTHIAVVRSTTAYVLPTITTTPTPLIELIVASGPSVNLREGPGTDYTRVGTVFRGDVLAVYSKYLRAGLWYEVRNEDIESAWIFSNLVNLDANLATILPTASSISPTPRFVPTQAPLITAAAPEQPTANVPPPGGENPPTPTPSRGNPGSPG